jgi:hypothetical protein
MAPLAAPAETKINTNLKQLARERQVGSPIRAYVMPTRRHPQLLPTGRELSESRSTNVVSTCCVGLRGKRLANRGSQEPNNRVLVCR